MYIVTHCYMMQDYNYNTLLYDAGLYSVILAVLRLAS